MELPHPLIFLWLSPFDNSFNGGPFHSENSLSFDGLVLALRD